jgi:fumarate reductase flavoprotein subunit
VPTLGGIETEPGSRRTDYTDRWARITPSEQRDPHEIYVTEDGERFVAEDTPRFNDLQNALLDGSVDRFWVVFDEAGLESADPPVVSGRDRNEIREMARAGDVAWLGEDLETLAERAGIDAEGLASTVASYNEGVETGDDPFGRSFLTPIDSPPYYALLTHDTTLTTHGGIAVDDSLRVLDEGSDPIPDLYAAGEAIGAGALTGRDFASGMLLTPALSFGRILGRRLAGGSH